VLGRATRLRPPRHRRDRNGQGKLLPAVTGTPDAPAWSLPTPPAPAEGGFRWHEATVSMLLREYLAAVGADRRPNANPDHPSFACRSDFRASPMKRLIVDLKSGQHVRVIHRHPGSCRHSKTIRQGPARVHSPPTRHAASRLMIFWRKRKRSTLAQDRNCNVPSPRWRERFANACPDVGQ
jgi:hypothetical protein